MYGKLPNLVLGFHGCEREVRDEVVSKGSRLNPSTNDYDWLGSGSYFWEQSHENAGFRSKTHVQICVRNPNCIKGRLVPRAVDGDWPIP